MDYNTTSQEDHIFNLKVCNNVLEAIGNTPLIKLNKLVPANTGQVWVKYEALNPGGAIKARSAFGMILDAEKKGLINKDTIIVEPSSGNQGIGVAMVGAAKGYKVKVVMPECMSIERRKIIEAFGAEVILTPKGSDISETFENCIRAAFMMKEEDPRVFIPQQFENPANPEFHSITTAREILVQTQGALNAFVAGIGTGGTITGVGRVLKNYNPNISIVGVEPANASILSGGNVGHHQQEGIGDGFIPDNLDRNLLDKVVVVDDDAALNTARELARKEGILSGISGGSNVWSAIEIAKELGPDKKVVTVIPDTGERYLSTNLFSIQGGIKC